MTDITRNSGRTAADTGSRFGDAVSRLRVWYANYGEYRKIRDELSGLDDRELTDLGIDRYRINAIAREHAFGA